MMKRATLLWALMAVAAGAGLLVMKYEIRGLEERLAGLNRDILRHQEAIHVLRAEWSFLNQPARLEDLARRLLRLEPSTADQPGRISDIPMRTEDDDVAPEALSPSAQTAPQAADRLSPLFASMKRAK